MNDFWDRLGISTSILCVLHCLLTPFLLMFLPMVGATLAEGWFHTMIIATAVPVAILAFWNGYRIHRHTPMLWLAGLGFLSMMAAVHFAGEHNSIESAFMLTAGVLLAIAHFLNLRAIRSAKH